MAGGPHFLAAQLLEELPGQFEIIGAELLHRHLRDGKMDKLLLRRTSGNDPVVKETLWETGRRREATMKDTMASTAAARSEGVRSNCLTGDIDAALARDIDDAPSGRGWWLELD